MSSRSEKVKKSLPVPSNAVSYVDPVRERHLFDMQVSHTVPPRFQNDQN